MWTVDEMMDFFAKAEALTRYCNDCEVSYASSTARDNKCVLCGKELEANKVDASARNSIKTQ